MHAWFMKRQKANYLKNEERIKRYELEKQNIQAVKVF